MSEFLAESGQELLIEIIRALCKEQDAESLIQIFKEKIQSITQEEVNNAFSTMASEGHDFQNNEQVIQFYHSVVQEKLSANTLNQFPEGHPRLSKWPCFIVIILLLFGFHLKNS